MSTYKRVSGNLTIQTLNSNSLVTFEGPVANAATVFINGNLSVSGNATLSGNISGDKLFNGTSAIEIPAPNGNANISIGGVSNVAVFTTTGMVVDGNINAGNLALTGSFSLASLSATGNITGGNLISNGNTTITRNAGVAQPTLIFLDTDTVIANNQVIGSIEWFTSTSPGFRTTSAIRSIASGTGGNADVHILTNSGNVGLSAKVVVLSTGNVGIANASPNSNLAVAGNVYVSTTITAVGNIDGGNVNTAIVSATGNVTAANLVTGGVVSATGNITAGNISTANINATGAISTTGNVRGGNLLSDAAISATGDISAIGLASIQGNITGGNLLTAGTITATGNISSVGNVRGGNILTAGLVSVTGNITAASNIFGGNITTSGTFSAAGNVNADTASYFIGNGRLLTGVVATGNATDVLQNGTTSFSIPVPNANIDGVVSGVSILTFYSGGQLLTGQLSATGNVSGSNVNATTGNVSAVGNVNAGNIFTTGIANIGTLITTNINANALTSGIVSSDRLSGSYTINITGSAGTAATVINAAQGNITSLGTLTSLAVTGNVTGGNFGTAGLVTATGNVTGGNVITAGAISAGSAGISTAGNITGGNLVGVANVNSTTFTGTTVSVIGNVTGGNLLSPGLISVVGNITGGNLLGVANVNSTLYTGTTISVSGNVNAGNIITGGLVSVTGNITAGSNVSGSNINGSNLYSVGIVSAAGNITGGNISTSNINATTHTGTTVNVTGNITGGNVTTAGVLTVNSGAAATAIVNGAGNAVGNIGSSTGFFNQLFATATTALYADLAEKYTADADYAPGTVVSFGGTEEITLSVWDSDRRVAGVVSTNPSYLMNAGLDAEHVAVVALQGRVACRVQGPVRKGDMMVSNGNGVARSEADPKTGAVIGKALENFSGESGTIEVVVGRI
jgi:filamentous hemagglutinin